MGKKLTSVLSFSVLTVLLRGKKPKSVLIYSALTVLLLLATIFVNNYQHLLRKRLANPTGFIMQTYQALGTLYDAGLTTISSIETAIQSTETPIRSGLRTISLRVEKGSLKEMVSNIPESAKARYYKAWLKYPDGKWRRIKYRMRGRSAWHFDYEKPSLRLKLRKNNPINLLRHINLINPEDQPMLANILADDLARSMGVMAHASEMVRLFINGRFAGVYQLQTREDEEMLRLNGRLPGPIYHANYLEQTWAKKDFEITAEDKGIENLKTDPIEALVSAIYMPSSPEKYDHLWASMDFNKYAKWDVGIVLVGDMHADWQHNHIFYFDPSRGVLEPMMNDANGHGMVQYPKSWRRLVRPDVPDFKSPLNGQSQPLLDAALRDPRFHHARNTALYKALKGGASLESQTKLLQVYFKAMDADVYADRNKGALQDTFGGILRLPYSNRVYEKSKSKMIDWIRNRNGFLLDLLDQTSVRAVISGTPRNGRTYFVLEVGGNTAVNFDASAFGGGLWADRTLNGESGKRAEKVELLHPGLIENKTFVYDKFYYSYFPRVPDHILMPGVQRYLFATEADPKSIAKMVAGAFKNALSGDRVSTEITMIDEINPAAVEYNAVSVHPWRFAKPAVDIVVLGPGKVTLWETLMIGPKQRLEIKPGTEVLLDAGVSIISRGNTKIVGNAAAPIIIRRLRDDRAWGAIVIQGSSARDSRIAFSKISGGTLDNIGNVPYSGMVNIHWADGFRLQDSTIEANEKSDDTLHIVHSKFTIARTSLRNCDFDCIDLDYANGVIEDLKITNAGNDGMDLMSSEVSIRGFSVTVAKDKGLSIGELSNVTATDGTIKNAAIGIAVKDRSGLSLSNWALVANDIGIDVYKKNWRYGSPGKSDISTTRFESNRLDLRVAKRGEVVLHNITAPLNTEGDGAIRREMTVAGK